MAKGGARTNSGPPPDPNALRRDRDSGPGGEWRELAADARLDADPPAWPISKTTAPERRLWVKLWTLPQAVVWEEQRQELEVALYVRRFVEAAERYTPASLSTLVRQLADSLGLTTPGLRSHRWTIVPTAKASTVPALSSNVRERLRVVRGDGQD